MDELAGKVALITGASRGIGKSIALELAAAGCDLMLTARDSKALEAVAGKIRALGRKAIVHAADLTASGEPAGLMQAFDARIQPPRHPGQQRRRREARQFL